MSESLNPRNHIGKKAKVKLLTDGGYLYVKGIKTGNIMEAKINGCPSRGVQVLHKHYEEGLYFMDGEIEIVEIL
jgi:hypothetical protein